MTVPDAIQEMLAANLAQRDWYDRRAAHCASAEPGELHRTRAALRRFRSELGLDELVIDLQRQWLEPLQQADVLDLGCFTGNALSIDIARQSRSYLGLDLSAQAVRRLNAKLAGEGLANARAIAGDILDPRSLSGFHAYRAGVAPRTMATALNSPPSP